MIYITVRQHQKPYQLNFEDIILDRVPVNFMNQDSNVSGTVTRRYETAPEYALEQIDVGAMIRTLDHFNKLHQNLFDQPRDSLYHHFRIPKKTGGWRDIDEPLPELMNALRELSAILREFGGLYHTAAMAYVEKRSIVTAVKRHVDFGSNWYLKTDLTNFFGSTTLEFAMKMLSMVFPFSEIVKSDFGRETLEKTLSLGFLRGGLPQGTPLSPSLTNLIMIPIDHKLFNEFASRAMVYTRYADDIHVSAKENFPYRKMVSLIKETFAEFDAPYKMKDEKTHYGSVKGQNWILGLMANADHNITVGFQKKKYFKAMLCNFILDTKNHKPWPIEDVQSLYGTMQYYRMIEKDYFNGLIEKANVKWHVNAEEMLKSCLRIG